MESELQRLRFRIRQLEREVRALRTAAHPSVAPAPAPAPADRPPASPRAAPFGGRRVLKTPAGGRNAGDA